MKWPSPTELVALDLLRDHSELYGLQLVQLSEGALNRGGVYVLLDRLEEKGLIKSRKVAPPQDRGGLPRRLYRITGAGERALAAVDVFAAGRARRA
jgi:PadR family transcriptional regulator, regulatory protein PadR